MEQMEPILRQGLETLGLPTDAIPQLQQYAKLLLETNKQEVFADIAAWLDKQLAKQ